MSEEENSNIPEKDGIPPQPKQEKNKLFFQKENSERPLECSECKKSIDIYYSEIVGNNIATTCMCKECPILQQRLYGSLSEGSSKVVVDNDTGLCCGNCDTTLEDVRTGNPLGCEECYEVFSDVLVMEMLASNKISHKLLPDKEKKSKPIHIGRSPGETEKINPSLRLIALNEAINETLSREDYEQAAWLRDQIKEIEKNQSKEQLEGPNEGSK